jgi:hypothetical protein
MGNGIGIIYHKRAGYHTWEGVILIVPVMKRQRKRDKKLNLVTNSGQGLYRYE